MGSLAARTSKCLSLARAINSSLDSPKVKMFCSTISFEDDEENNAEISDSEFLTEKKEMEPQCVDPKKGWNFRGVHKAIICGRIGQAPVQKMLRNGKTVTIFTVGTGGMYDQRILNTGDLPKPVQWHRVVVHNEHIGAYAVQQMMKNSSVFVEGDIETRIYNDNISGQSKSIAEICLRRDGKLRVIKGGEKISNLSTDDQKDGLSELLS